MNSHGEEQSRKLQVHTYLRLYYTPTTATRYLPDLGENDTLSVETIPEPIPCVLPESSQFDLGHERLRTVTCKASPGSVPVLCLN